MLTTRTVSIDLTERERKEAATARRFPVSVSSEAPVSRRDWQSGETFSEILRHTPEAVDLSRAPLPVIEGHDRSKANIAIVTGLRVEGGKLRGELQFGNSQRATELVADVAAGIVRWLSIGYLINEFVRDEEARTLTATRWTPHEVSIVSVPADFTVGINRSADMPDSTNPESPAVPTTANREEASILAERNRALTIRSVVAQAGLETTFADALVNRGASVEEARSAILNELADRSEATQINGQLRVDAFGPSITAGNGDDFQRAAVDALLIRAGVAVEKPHPAAHDVSPSIGEIARTCLSRSGQRSFWGAPKGAKLFERALSTSDFPAILAGALHASVRRGWEIEPQSHRAWVRPVSVPDFRLQHRPILGSAPSLAKVNESGEYTYGSLDEDSTSYKIAKYGKIVSISWEALVNDNLDAFLRIQPALGQAARRLEADLVYALLAENAGLGPIMQDGTALFDASHGNLVDPAAAFSASLIAIGRTMIRRQTAIGGGYLALAPRHLICPPELETDAELLVANASRRTSVEKATAEWLGSLNLVVEPRLAADAVFLAADNGQIDTVELGLLDENFGGPVIEEDREFGRDVIRWKVRHVCGAKVLDWRGLVRIPIASK